MSKAPPWHIGAGGGSSCEYQTTTPCRFPRHLRHVMPLVAITQEGRSSSPCRHSVHAPGSRHPASQRAGDAIDGTACFTAPAMKNDLRKAIIQGPAINIGAPVFIHPPVDPLLIEGFGLLGSRMALYLSRMNAGTKMQPLEDVWSSSACPMVRSGAPTIVRLRFRDEGLGALY